MERTGVRVDKVEEAEDSGSCKSSSPATWSVLSGLSVRLGGLPSESSSCCSTHEDVVMGIGEEMVGVVEWIGELMGGVFGTNCDGVTSIRLDSEGTGVGPSGVLATATTLYSDFIHTEV